MDPEFRKWLKGEVHTAQQRVRMLDQRREREEVHTRRNGEMSKIQASKRGTPAKRRRGSTAKKQEAAIRKLDRAERRAATNGIMTRGNDGPGGKEDHVNDLTRSVTTELRPLAKHLKSKGAMFEDRGDHVYAFYNGVKVTMFTKGGKTGDPRAKKNAVAALKREWPALLEGFEGFKNKNGAQELDPPERRPANPGGVDERRDWADATRIRLRTALKDHEMSNSDFVRWAIEVGKERSLEVWGTLNNGQSMIGKFLNDEKTVPVAKYLQLVDAAIDAAYGTPEKPATHITREVPEKVTTKLPEEAVKEDSVLASQEAKDLTSLASPPPTPTPEDLIEEAHEVIRARDAEVARLIGQKAQLEEALAQRDKEVDDLRTALANTDAALRNVADQRDEARAGQSQDPKNRYLELLFKLAEDGNEMAMDRIEKILG